MSLGEGEDLPFDLGTSNEPERIQLMKSIQSEKVSTLVARPQVLAKLDPQLRHFERILLSAAVEKIPIRSLRDALKT
jgi:predicted transcriptional regulator